VNICGDFIVFVEDSLLCVISDNTISRTFSSFGKVESGDTRKTCVGIACFTILLRAFYTFTRNRVESRHTFRATIRITFKTVVTAFLTGEFTITIISIV
jgi:hypothetical protein